MRSASVNTRRRAGLVLGMIAVVLVAGGGWELLRWAGVVSWSPAGACGAVDNTRRAGDVNVVIFVIDTLRADRLNAYGYERRMTSPNIDALAREGVLFEKAYAAAPWTLPSMASLMTSRFVCEHGVASTRQRIGEGVATLPKQLHSIGFTTIGLYANSMVSPEFGFGDGYDFYQVSFTNEGEQVRRAREMHAGRPFFLMVHNLEPHNPEFFAPPHTEGFRDVGEDVRGQIAEHYKQYRIATWQDYEAGRSLGATRRGGDSG